MHKGALRTQQNRRPVVVFLDYCNSSAEISLIFPFILRSCVTFATRKRLDFFFDTDLLCNTGNYGQHKDPPCVHDVCLWENGE